MGMGGRTGAPLVGKGAVEMLEIYRKNNVEHPFVIFLW